MLRWFRGGLCSGYLPCFAPASPAAAMHSCMHVLPAQAVPSPAGCNGALFNAAGSCSTAGPAVLHALR